MAGGPAPGNAVPSRVPLTLVAGAALILTCELLLFAVELPARDWARVPLPPGRALPRPQGWLGSAGRSVAHNITPLCWVGYLLVFDGLLARLARRRGRPDLNAIRARPNRFVFLWLASVPLWCYFDWVNFRFMGAWAYHGLPPSVIARYGGYMIAFAAICPGMFLAAHWLNALGMDRLRARGVRIGLPLQVMILLLGVSFVAYPFAVRTPIGNLTLWVSLMFLLDPLNHWLGAPSVIGDWRAGRFGRTLSLMAGGAICGLCWEFWNYWAVAKWTYDLPFLGSWEQYRYFEMPWLGFLGFPAFAVECWVVLNTAMLVFSPPALRLVEPLPDDAAVL